MDTHSDQLEPEGMPELEKSELEISLSGDGQARDLPLVARSKRPRGVDEIDVTGEFFELVRRIIWGQRLKNRDAILSRIASACRAFLYGYEMYMKHRREFDRVGSLRKYLWTRYFPIHRYSDSERCYRKKTGRRK